MRTRVFANVCKRIGPKHNTLAVTKRFETLWHGKKAVTYVTNVTNVFKRPGDMFQNVNIINASETLRKRKQNVIKRNTNAITTVAGAKAS